MKVSLDWLNSFFESPLPDAAVLEETLTFHVAEVEERTDRYLDVKVLPDRAAYLLSHRGVALELSAALERPLKEDPLRTPVDAFPATDLLSVSVEEASQCARYMAALVRGVKIAPSPEWLKTALESVGQRSINNVVDATNYVMLNIGQPLHAFDAKLLTEEGGKYAIRVRGAHSGEAITTLSNEEYALPEGTLLITDAYADAPIGIAGVKGGARAAITEATTDLIIESANFDAVRVRKAAQALKLFTDASNRFQNRPSPALAGYALRDVVALITAIAGGNLIGVAEHHPLPLEVTPVTVSLAVVNGILGASFTREEVIRVFDSLGFSYTESEGVFTVLPPFERRDIAIPENLVEEIGRILGYERIPSVELPPAPSVSQEKFRGIERVKDFLVERGFIEISSQSFSVDGDIELANALQADKPWLRSTMLTGMKESLERAVSVAPRVLGPAPLVKVFELGTIFTVDGERLALALGVAPLSVKAKAAEDALKENVATIEQELLQMPGRGGFALDGRAVEFLLTDDELARLGNGYDPVRPTMGAYRPFSVYPFALRDVAVWTPTGTPQSIVEDVIRREAGSLLVRLDLFDTFEKEGRVSYAFRLVFESPEKTLTDAELNPVMARITEALNGKEGFEVR